MHHIALHTPDAIKRARIDQPILDANRHETAILIRDRSIHDSVFATRQRGQTAVGPSRRLAAELRRPENRRPVGLPHERLVGAQAEMAGSVTDTTRIKIRSL